MVVGLTAAKIRYVGKIVPKERLRPGRNWLRVVATDDLIVQIGIQDLGW